MQPSRWSHRQTNLACVAKRQIVVVVPRCETPTLASYSKNGDVVLAVNGLDHDQYVDASRLLLRHGDGNVLTLIIRWPSNANP